MPSPATRSKSCLRWGILGLTLAFLAQALWQNWQAILEIRIGATGWRYLTIALGVTLLAHSWSGWVWGWILQTLDQPISNAWSTQVYLKTNIAKYLPGNVWHFYGRVRALQTQGVSLPTAIMGVLMEPLLMAAAAVMVALISIRPSWPLQGLALGSILIGIHPAILNRLLMRLERAKLKDPVLLEPVPPGRSPLEQDNARKFTEGGEMGDRRQPYPWKPLLGEVGFVLLRGLGFVLVLQALHPLSWEEVPILLGGFSWAWLLGLLVPGAPGGLGVFEATALALLQGHLTPAIVLSGVALYRMTSILSEITGAGLASLATKG